MARAKFPEQREERLQERRNLRLARIEAEACRMKNIDRQRAWEAHVRRNEHQQHFDDAIRLIEDSSW